MVCRAFEREPRRELVALLAKRFRIEVPCPFIEHSGQKICESYPVRRFARGTAAKRITHGDERDRVFLNQPGLDATGTLDLADLECLRRYSESQPQDRGKKVERKQTSQHGLSSD